MSDIGTAVEKLIPKSLDEIIRRHRDQISLRLSTAEDFAALQTMVSSVEKQMQIRATINEWRIVSLVLGDSPEENKLVLTGIHQADDVAWCTSPIVSIDFENNLALTANSLYQLGSQGDGEPGLDIIMNICHCLHKWGVGKYLGVLEVF
jgi:hypothetical protein